MNLFESERKVMDVLWREGSITAGKIAKILNIDIGWNRNTTYTVINKCIKKGYISRGEDKFLCTPVITKDEVKIITQFVVGVKKTAYSTCACFSTASFDTASCHTAMLTLNNNDYVLSIANLLNNFGNIRADTFLKLKSF